MAGADRVIPEDPSRLEIVSYPHPVLQQRAEPVTEFGPSLAGLAERMIDLMREAEGIGLAAPQVALPMRMFVCDVPSSLPEDHDPERDANAEPPSASLGPLVFVNPRLVRSEGGMTSLEEGCLSLPDIRGEVRRPPMVTVEAQGVDGKTFSLTAAGLLARCIQHENDHLDGVLILTKFSRLDRMKNRNAVARLESEASIF